MDNGRINPVVLILRRFQMQFTGLNLFLGRLYILGIIISATLITWSSAMAQEENNYLSDAATVDEVYSLIKSSQVDSAADYLKGLGDDKVVIQAWIAVQCDINNIKKDPRASAELGWKGVKYSLEKGYKMPTAMMLHNISAFFMPSFDENVDPETVPMILDAARQQVPLRRDIGQPVPLLWALWDLGLAHLVSGNYTEAISALEEGVNIAGELDDREAEAWCRIFIGKCQYLHFPDLKAEGEKTMREAAAFLSESKEDWVRESSMQIMESVKLK